MESRRRIVHRVRQGTPGGSHTAGGFDLGAGLIYCLTDRLSLLGRHDDRRVNGLSRDDSTVQIGLRWRF